MLAWHIGIDHWDFCTDGHSACSQETALLAFWKWRFFRVLEVHYPNSFKPRNSLANLFTSLRTLSLPLHVTSDPDV